MGAVEDLAAAGGDLLDKANEIGAILDLESVGLRVTGARRVGRGGSASGDLYLSDGTSLYFERIRDLAKPAFLRAELAATTGATPAITGDQAIRVLALFTGLAEEVLAYDGDEIAREWGATFLQLAPAIDLDMNDQRERWGAFQALESVDPVSLRAAGETTSIPAGAPVLRHLDGTRYVRTGWMRAYVRAEEAISSTELANRMQRVGWNRRGRTGRVKATRPDMPGELVWTFYAVPPGWETTEQVNE